jgi:hypothetical protein
LPPPADRDPEDAVPEHEAEKSLPLEQRMEVFLALVEAQDRELAVPQSRKAVAEKFGVSEHQVRKIEREGLDGVWPPLA